MNNEIALHKAFKTIGIKFGAIEAVIRAVLAELAKEDDKYEVFRRAFDEALKTAED